LTPEWWHADLACQP